ncbi:hypothetical protein CMI37_27900 [Candidatus Pacearchaeota archaeon]|nr:hypothetical protein [Candidatus Pacearchaeota archaeon]
MQFIIAQTKHGLRLQVFNCGFAIATHFGQRKYLKRTINQYKARMSDPNHAAHGKQAHVIWA